MAVPASSGYTNFPKATLSYRWVISDGKFLQTQRYSQQQPGQAQAATFQFNTGVQRGNRTSTATRGGVQRALESPIFIVSVPKNSCGGRQETSWSLSINNGKLFLCQKAPVSHGVIGVTNPVASSQRHAAPAQLQIRHAVVVESTERATSLTQVTSFHNFCIVDCVASIIDQETGKSKHTIKLPDGVEGSVSDSLMVSFGDDNLLTHLVPSKPVVIQVTATILFHTNPIGTLNKTGEVSPDNTLKLLYESKIFTDLTIKCGDREFKSHKAILACRSPVFKRMLEADMKEKHCSVIEISDISPAVMSDLLAFVYTNASPNMNTLAKELMAAANKYELPRLLAASENTLMMSLMLENVVETLVHAEMHQASNLKQACLKLVKDNSADVFKSDSWKEFKEMDEYKTLVFEVLEFSVL